MKQSRRAIALLITTMFVIVITVAIGFGLKQVNEASQIVEDEKFMYQSRIILEDVLNILKTSKEVQLVLESDSAEGLFILISQAGFIPFENSGLEIIMKISSARGKFNPSQLKDSLVRQDAMKQYLNNYMINNQYVDILVDSMGGIKDDNSYNSRIFDEKPYLYRDYIASSEHLEEINDFYTKEFNDNSLKKINFDDLFYYSVDANSSIDLNYATTEVWEMLLSTTKERAEFLADGAGSYIDNESLNLNDNELEHLALFQTSFFEPILFVEVEITKKDSTSNINFEYDIKEKKGSNFVYEI